MRIYLPAELCYDAHLPKNFTEDTQKMRALSEYKLLKPAERKRRIDKLLSKFQEDKVLKNWGIEIDQNMLEVNGKVLHRP